MYSSKAICAHQPPLNGLNIVYHAFKSISILYFNKLNNEKEQNFIINFTKNDPTYPASLHQRLGEEAPPLTVCGPSTWLNDTSHAIIALFSSVKAPARAILQAHELAQQWRTQPVTLISGFQSPLEEEVWSVLLQDIVNPSSRLPEQDAPRLVKILARSMAQRFSPQERHGMATGALAFISPFPESVKRPTKATAHFRNSVAAALADSVLIAHAEVGSSTAHLQEQVRQWGGDIRLFTDLASMT